VRKKGGLKIKYLSNVISKIAEGTCSRQYLQAINKELGCEKEETNMQCFWDMLGFK
jgi:hypothetical protein